MGVVPAGHMRDTVRMAAREGNGAFTILVESHLNTLGEGRRTTDTTSPASRRVVSASGYGGLLLLLGDIGSICSWRVSRMHVARTGITIPRICVLSVPIKCGVLRLENGHLFEWRGHFLFNTPSIR